jgi:Toprim domain
LAQTVLGLDKRGAVNWAKEFLGLPANGRPADPELIERQQREAEERRKVRDAEKARERADRVKSAWKIWDEAKDYGPGFDYLRYRGIDPAYADAELRSHPDLPYSEGGSFPALIGRITGPDGDFAGIWRIYVAKNGKGKAPVEAPKRGLGVAHRGAIRIGGVENFIGIAEGIETALAVRQLLKEQTGLLIPVWAALSANGMQSVEVPSSVRHVRIYPDADLPRLDRGKPSVGLTAAKVLASRLEHEAVNVSIIRPPVGSDWLDRLNALRAA